MTDTMRRLARWRPTRLAIIGVAIALTGLNTLAIPLFGLGRWQRVLTRLTPVSKQPPSATTRDCTIERTMAVMAAAHRRRLLPGSCLARSLALQTVLAASGVCGDLRVGVRRHGAGVEAHAWIDCEGRRLDLDAEQGFSPFDKPLQPERESKQE